MKKFLMMDRQTARNM